ncbi:MAG: hypothetical protein CSA55_05720 [Ilumatobacter coccineus]|uniref:Cytochrome c maturation protein CcmE n=1 Tax=Ilumatobacter coccineus TaxID=467094 RepID=A0A2G6K8W7_9ACTN|nr:MAG: hypothetical protein CSA55_05720 [Ilumatobacter coccineus]
MSSVKTTTGTAMADLTPRPPSGPEPITRRRSILIAGIVVVLIAIGGAIMTRSLRSAVDYYCTVDEIGHREGCELDRRLRVHGIVQPGIVHRGDKVIFDLALAGETVSVHYRGQLGGLFGECAPVVVHGQIDATTGVLQGDHLVINHSNEYVAEARGNSDQVCGDR